MVLLSSIAQGESRLPASSVRVPADSMRSAAMRGMDGLQANAISGVVRTIFQDTGGNMWFGTQDGPCRYDGTSLAYYDLRDESGAGVTVTAIVEDHEGAVWLGTTGGVTRFDGETFTTFSEDDGMTSKYVWSLFADAAGLLWIGTYDGACRFDGKTFTPFPIPASTRVDTTFGPTSPTVVWDIAQDKAGNMWFATEGGAYKYDGETVSRVPVMEEEADTFVRCIRGDTQGGVWFSTRYKGMIRLKDGAFTNVSQEEGLSGIEVGKACEDRSGNIWFSAENVGVYRYDGTAFTRFSKEDGLPSQAIHCVLEDGDGRMWFGGWMGVWRRDGESFVAVTREGPW